MNLLSNLQFSLYNIFELYKTQGKRWYGFSTLFSIFSAIFTTLFVSIVVMIMDMVIYSFIGETFSFYQFIYSSDFLMDVSMYIPFMSVLSIGIYGVFLHEQAQHPTQKITFSLFFKSISGFVWKWYFLFTIGGIVVSKILYLFLTPTQHQSPDSLGQFLSLYAYNSSFMEWLFSIGRLIVDLLPLLLVFQLMRTCLRKRSVVLSKNAAKTALFSLLILSFTVNHFSGFILNFVNNYVFSLIRMPFEEPLIPSILSISVYVFLISIFLLGLAAATVFPFLSKPEEQAETTPLTDEP